MGRTAATRASADEELAQAIGHAFARPALLTEALTHPSASAPARGKSRQRGAKHDYERLEFLGDRVLGLVVSDMLFRRFKSEPEGHLTRRLAELVRRDTLAKLATELGLDRHLVLSPAEASAGTARNPGILADVCEAMIAALYLDGGLAAAEAFIDRRWTPLIDAMPTAPSDPKTRLQEWAQARSLGLPAYRVLATDGPDHALRFTVAVSVGESDEATATASSKRAAEADAAAALLAQLGDPARAKAP
jgi:ribonuclease III